MNKPLIHRPSRSRGMLTAMKALVLVAAAWGGVYPSLLWSLERLLKT